MTPRPKHPPRRRWLILLIITLVGFALYQCSRSDFMPWQTVSTDFMKGNGTESYGPGDFRILGDRLVSMRLARPKITFKPRTEEQRKEGILEESEPWMKNTAEILNRTSASIFVGDITTSRKTFEQYGQNAAWWLSHDGNTAYLATDWMDYHFQPKGDEAVPQATKLWKSIDGGKTWQPMRWKEDQDIGFLHFLDAERGYAIGWGPHLWRTGNGGLTWQTMQVPAQARDVKNPRKTFDLVALGKDHVLRMAFVPAGSTTGTSEVYALKWGESTPTPAFDVPGHIVNNLLDDSHGNIYVVAVTGPVNDWAHQVTTLFFWDGHTLRMLHTFEEGLVGYAVYLTPKGHLLVQGADYASLMPKDWSALSQDAGKTWSIDKDSSAQGGYYDPATGTDWRVSGYTLSKRMIP